MKKDYYECIQCSLTLNREEMIVRMIAWDEDFFWRLIPEYICYDCLMDMILVADGEEASDAEADWVQPYYGIG